MPIGADRVIVQCWHRSSNAALSSTEGACDQIEGDLRIARSQSGKIHGEVEGHGAPGLTGHYLITVEATGGNGPNLPSGGSPEESSGSSPSGYSSAAMNALSTCPISRPRGLNGGQEQTKNYSGAFAPVVHIVSLDAWRMA